MGYTTEFMGYFEINPPLKKEHKDYLYHFSDTIRMTRDASKTILLKDPIRIKANLPVGPHGQYYVGGAEGNDVTDTNEPAHPQPGLWCNWIPNEDGTKLLWNQQEKFYYYIPWLKYLIKHFLKPWNYTLSGVNIWQGESSEDTGIIFIKNNVVNSCINFDNNFLKDPYKLFMHC